MGEDIFPQENDLLSLSKVSDIALVVNSSSIKSGACFFERSARDQNKFDLVNRELTLVLTHVTLYDFIAPFPENS